MRKRDVPIVLIALTLVTGPLRPAAASTPRRFDVAELEAAFKDAEVVDLATSKSASVVKLRSVVEIEPPTTPVLVKTFKSGQMPGVLQPVFAKQGVKGVTINGRFVAILHTDFPKEYEDVLAHELVHSYITMASPQPLPFWFQEASAVHFSLNKGGKFYGQPSKKRVGVMEGRYVELTPTYKQKLQSFHFLIEQVGEEKFYEWYKNAVETGNTDARPLLGLDASSETEKVDFVKPFPLWLGVLIAVVVVIVLAAGYIASKRTPELY